MELVEFLRRMLDEDERVARAAGVESMEWAADSTWLHDMIDPLPSQRRAGMVPGLTQADAAHIALHDPARVLLEVEAKRRIVEMAAFIGAAAAPPDSSRASMTTITDGRYRVLYDVLRLLALPYADAPGFRPEWKPE